MLKGFWLNCLVTFSISVSLLGFVARLHADVIEVEWEEVCDATTNSQFGTGHPDFCICTNQCREVGSATSIGCGEANESIGYFNGIPYCRCDCFQVPVVPPDGP